MFFVFLLYYVEYFLHPLFFAYSDWRQVRVELNAAAVVVSAVAFAVHFRSAGTIGCAMAGCTVAAAAAAVTVTLTLEQQGQL